MQRFLSHGYFDLARRLLQALPLRLLGKNSQWPVPDLRQSGRSGFYARLTATGSYRIFTCFPEMTKELYHSFSPLATEFF